MKLTKAKIWRFSKLGLIGLVLAWRVFPSLLTPIYIMLLRWLYT